MNRFADDFGFNLRHGEVTFMMDTMLMDNGQNALLNRKLKYFDGKIVRKDLTKSIGRTNVPVYVLEFLLGQY